jgi:two-component system sensor histidine kinase HydH
VRDAGPGIAPQVLKNLFVPFFTTKDRGTGLGLAISQRMVEEMGGRIEVVSHLGDGATFTVLLPVGEPHGLRAGPGSVSGPIQDLTAGLGAGAEPFEPAGGGATPNSAEDSNLPARTI